MPTVMLAPPPVNDLLTLHPTSLALAPQGARLALAALFGMIIVAAGVRAVLRIMLGALAQVMRPIMLLTRTFFLAVLSTILVGAMLLSGSANAQHQPNPVPTPASSPVSRSNPAATAASNCPGPTGTASSP